VNEETWTEMRILDCYDRTRGEVDKERVYILDGMKVADALERKLPFDGGDGDDEVALTMRLTPVLLAADVRSGLYRLVGNQPATQQPTTSPLPPELPGGLLEAIGEYAAGAADYHSSSPPPIVAPSAPPCGTPWGGPKHCTAATGPQGLAAMLVAL
jgi:hypothetical protein